MGDRISIQFKKEGYLSAPLFGHWDGLELKERAEGYVQLLVTKNILKFTETNDIPTTLPLDRLEPGTVMVSFISEVIGQGDRILSNYYMPDQLDCGDNSDNGHFVIDIDKIEKMLWDAYDIGTEKKGKKLLEECQNS